MGCDPKCYTNGKACAISDDGKCAIIYDVKQNDYVRNFKAATKKIEEEYEYKYVKSLRTIIKNVKPQPKTKG